MMDEARKKVISHPHYSLISSHSNLSNPLNETNPHGYNSGSNGGSVLSCHKKLSHFCPQEPPWNSKQRKFPPSRFHSTCNVFSCIFVFLPLQTRFEELDCFLAGNIPLTNQFCLFSPSPCQISAKKFKYKEPLSL